MPRLERLRDLFLVPTPETPAMKPARADLRRLTPAERRRAKIRYQAESGLFRTWVYVVILLLLVGGFVLYIWLVT